MTVPSPANSGTGTATVTTRYAYDANNRLCRVLENASVDLQAIVDPCSTAVTGTATSNVSTRYNYTATGLLWHQYAPAPAGTTTYSYDSQGHQTGQIDANGNATTWTYDDFGNKLSETDPDTSPGDAPTVAYAYDAFNRLCRRLAVDPGVFLQTLADPCSTSVSAATIDTRYTYDLAGNVLTISDATAAGRTITATYDQLNRPLTVSGDKSGDPATTYEYGATSAARSDASGSYTATLDAYGRQVSLTDPLHSSGNLYGWTYAPSGDLATTSDPAGNTTTNTYDPLGRPTARSTTGASGCTNCAVYSKSFNSAGNAVSSTSTIATDPTNGTTAYAYDPLGRLTTYTPPTSSSLAAGVYTWNSQPDRASIKVGTADPVTTVFDAASRPTSDSAGNTYTSDREGRITGLPGKTLVYDAIGRLSQVKTAPGGAVLATYTYDSLDRLRTIDESGTTTRLRYVGMTKAVSQLIDDSDDTVIANHATDLSGVELFDFNPAGTLQTYLGRNNHGDVTWTSDSTGAVSSTAAYDPFGNLVGSTGSVPKQPLAIQLPGHHHRPLLRHRPLVFADDRDVPIPGPAQRGHGRPRVARPLRLWRRRRD